MELEKRRERYLFDKVVDRIQIIEQMVEMRDHGKELNPREMELISCSVVKWFFMQVCSPNGDQRNGKKAKGAKGG